MKSLHYIGYKTNLYNHDMSPFVRYDCGISGNLNILYKYKE